MIPKFRAWDTHEDVMNRVDYIDFAHGVIGLSNENVRDYEQPIHRVKLMQYACLKDKNGVEIYEGDIIKLIGTYKDSKGKELGRFKVGWDDYYTGFYPLIDDHLRGNSEWEVIGNIYENPELLVELEE